MEMLGYTYRLLAGGCVADKKHLLRGECVLELTKLLEKGFVNFLAPGGVVDLDISALAERNAAASCPTRSTSVSPRLPEYARRLAGQE
jgi:hypothetical protein